MHGCIGIQVCSYEGTHLIPMGNNYEISKIQCQILKSSPAKPLSQFIIIGTKHPWVKGIQNYSNEGPHLFQGEIITK